MVRGERYYCARGSFGYMQAEGVFPADGIEVLFRRTCRGPIRSWRAEGQFVPYLSVLDALFNIGPEGTLN